MVFDRVLADSQPLGDNLLRQILDLAHDEDSPCRLSQSCDSAVEAIKLLTAREYSLRREAFLEPSQRLGIERSANHIQGSLLAHVFRYYTLDHLIEIGAWVSDMRDIRQFPEDGVSLLDDIVRLEPLRRDPT